MTLRTARPATTKTTRTAKATRQAARDEFLQPVRSFDLSAETTEKATGRKIPYAIGGRRPGDIAVSYADPARAERELHWKARLTIEDAARDAYAFATKVLKEGD